MGAETKKKKKYLKFLITLYLLVLVVLYIVIYAYPRVSGALTPTTILTYDELKVWDDITCYLVRNEQVYTSEVGGAVTYYAEEGALARRGSRILELKPVSGGAIENYSCQRNGLISYYIDGNESYYTPENMASLKADDVKKRDENPVNTKRDSVLSGEPLYKLVDNDVWYAVFWVDSTKVSKYQKGSSVTLELSMGSIPGTVYDIVDNGDEWLIILKFERYFVDMPMVRKVEATAVTQDYKGLLVPNESLVTVEGKLGVYVKDISGEYKFKQVKVITTDGESSLVKDSYFYEDTDKGSEKVDTVKIYDEILKNGKP